MTEVPVTPQLLAYVLQNLWPRGEEELRRLGLSKADAFQRFWEYTKLGRSAVLVADEPVIVTGIATEDESFTWFQATDQFDRHARAITKYLRAQIKKHDGPLYIYSVCVHPDTEKWFRVLGFVPTDYQERLLSGALLRRFERKLCVVAAADHKQ